MPLTHHFETRGLSNSIDHGPETMDQGSWTFDSCSNKLDLLLMKKRTKPIIPGKEKAALALVKIRINKYKDKYATLWIAAKEFIKTKEYKYIIKIAKKQMVIKHGVGYYRTFRKDKNRQIKFVLNMFRDIKKVEEDYLTFHPKALYQTEETGFTPPKDIIKKIA